LFVRKVKARWFAMTPEEWIAALGELATSAARRWVRQQAALAQALRALEEGATLRQAAAAAGVHVATLCRWRRRSADCDREVAQPADGRLHRLRAPPRRRPALLARRPGGGSGRLGFV
jgi:Homeodomain-like domain